MFKNPYINVLSIMSEFEITNGVDQEASQNTKRPKTVIEEINEMRARGETNTAQFRGKMKELELILGIDQINPFGTSELDIFEEKLLDMALTDMQRLARRIGVNSAHDRPTIKKLLMREFKAHNRNNMRNAMPTAINSFVLDPTNPEHQKLEKILRDV